MLNLAVNARNAMPNGGMILVRAQNAPRVGSSGEGDHVSLSVTDTDTGMTPEIQARVFEPFLTPKDIGKGRG